jgi:methyl-accepting chemotaxis protein
MRRWSKSLISRAIALLLAGLALTSAVVGGAFARIQSNHFRGEVERRGTSMLQMLDRHQDLRLSLSLHDARATHQVLDGVLGSNSDIAYLGAADEKGKVIAWVSRGVSERVVANHDLRGESALSDESTSRFTRRVNPDRDSGMGLPGEQNAALGTLVMGIRTDLLSGAVARQTFAMVAASGVVLVATFGLFFALLSRRLRRMVRFAEELAAGDLAAHLTDTAEDEVGRLAAALLELRNNTRAVVAEMRDAAVAMESTSEEVFDGATRQLEHSRAQAASAAETERTMDDLRERFVRAQSNAQAVLDLAASSADSSREGEESIEHAVRAVSELGEQIDANTQMLNDLVERTRHVGRIIDAVRDLSAESKMLALNAAIVSSRSGTAGTGFAVIAHEVRALADRSQHSTAQVQEILAQILHAIEQATAVVEEGRRRADAGRAVAGQAGAAIRRLSDAIVRSSRAATEIANGTREQAEGVSRITGAVQRIARSAEEGAAGIGRLEGASRSIREHSSRMRALVERYRTAVLGAVVLALLPAAAKRLPPPPAEVFDLELAHVRLVALEVRAEHVRVVVPRHEEEIVAGHRVQRGLQ